VGTSLPSRGSPKDAPRRLLPWGIVALCVVLVTTLGITGISHRELRPSHAEGAWLWEATKQVIKPAKCPVARTARIRSAAGGDKAVGSWDTLRILTPEARKASILRLGHLERLYEAVGASPNII
jgi:hypothetical protein